MPEKVFIFDTTLRDGEQSPGCSMNLDEKLQMARQLDRLGVDILEAGFPIASQGDFEAVRAIAAEIRRPIIAGLARANELDIKRAWEALEGAEHPRIHTFLATSDIHLKYKLRKTREEVLKQITFAVALAKSLCQDVEFSPEDAGRTDRKYLIECCHAAVEAGATTLNLPDTVGYCMEPEYERMFADVKAGVPGMDHVILSTHTHDDLGMAVANTLAGIRGGARQVECTINGIGERAGNAALEEIVMAIYVRRDVLPLFTTIRAEELYPSSQLLTRLTGVAVQRLRPRSWHPPGRRAEERHHLRNHHPADRRHGLQPDCAGQALRPARPRQTLRRVGLPAHQTRTRERLRAVLPAGRSQEECLR
jgi:2-isopropylmalate synthase